MKKKVLSLALALTMALSLALPAAAADLPEGWKPADGARVDAALLGTKPIEGENSTYIPTAEEAEKYVNDKGWMTGTDKGFAPAQKVTRATVYEMFWKMEGQGVVNYALTYTDMPQGVWYTESARWATSEKLTTGTGNGRYEGDRNVTKAEVITILYRYMKDYKKLDVSVEGDWSLEVFEDAGKIQDWGKDAMLWAWLSGVACQLDSDPTLDPDQEVTRIELAQMLTVMGGDMDKQNVAWTTETISYESDGRTVPAIVTLPKSGEKVPAVVLAHGHGGSKDENVGFGGIAEALAQAGIASIRMDFPGCGDSTASFHDNTMTNMIADTKKAVEALKAYSNVDTDKLGILGYSMGGRIASEIVGEQDNPFSAVILLSAANGTARELAPNMFGKLATYNELKSTAKKDGFAAFTNIYNTTLELSKEWFEDMEDGQPLKSLAKFNGPVLVLHGDKDTMITDKMNQDNLKACKNGRELVVADADHGYGFYSDQPDVTAAVEGAAVGFFSEHLLGGVTGKAVAASKYGNIGTDISTAVIAGAGYEVGDILKVAITGQEELSFPYGTGYSNVDQGSPLALDDASAHTLAMAINRGDFATTYGLGTKNEDGASYTMTAGKTIKVSMGEKGGYLKEMELRAIDDKRTNERKDYASDAVFANFREITVGDVAKDRLFRGSSPVNPELGRNTYADDFLKHNGVKAVLNLADSEEVMKGYEGYDKTYYSTIAVKPLNLGVDVKAADFNAGLKEGLVWLTQQEGPYYFHCTEGKDRAGFVAALLEMLCGASVKEITEDYMLSFENYYFVKKNSEQWQYIAESNIEKSLLDITGAKDAAELAKVDTVKAAETYLTETVGLSADEVANLKDALTKK